MTVPRTVPWIAGLQPATHGAVRTFPPIEQPADGPGPAPVLDFSANGNVIGPPPAALRAIAEVDVSLFPDRRCTALRHAIGTHHNVPADWIVPGNGSTEIIWAVARAFLAPGDVTLVVEPTYGEYAVACQAVGAQVQRVVLDLPSPGTGGPRFKKVGAVTEAVQTLRPPVVWLCNPNNPTGALFPSQLLAELVQLASATLYVVDEAYLTLATEATSALSLAGTGQVLVIRSLTKDTALAGVRLGYGVADAAIASAVASMIPPWSVSSVAQAAGLAAMADPAHLARARVEVARSRSHLLAGLCRLGLNPYPTAANFVLVPVGDGAALTAQLLAEGIAVRDATSFGLPGCIRIGVRSIEDQERLLASLGKILGHREQMTGDRLQEPSPATCPLTPNP